MRVLAILLGCLTVAATSAARAGDGVYIGGGLGFASTMDSGFHVPNLEQTGKFSLKDASPFLIDGGFKFADGLRLELEGQYARFGGDKVSIDVLGHPTSALRGHLSQGTAYLNADYDFPIFGPLGGTIGAGVGSAWNDTKGSAFNGLSIVHGSDNAFAWQVGAGLIGKILPNLDVQLDYRYQGTGSTDITETGVGAFHLGSIKAQLVTVTARFYIFP